jgi:flavin reductase (DIM6/NTAB) family NADH-FMN oxidoreductase RutF
MNLGRGKISEFLLTIDAVECKMKSYITLTGEIVNEQITGIDPELLRRGMRQWASGVTVVTSMNAGERHGMTVNSFTSISLEPPLVLVSIEQGRRTHEMIVASQVFGITLLCVEQQEISDRFAGRIAENKDRFVGLNTYTLKSGVSFISGGLAGMDCRVMSAIDAGDHTLFIGDVVDIFIDSGHRPLIYYNRNYHRLVETPLEG